MSNNNTTKELKNRKYYGWLLGCMVHDPENFDKELEKALNDGFQINFTDGIGRTLLHLAAERLAVYNLAVTIGLKHLLREDLIVNRPNAAFISLINTPEVNVNKMDNNKFTPFGIICWNYVLYGNPKGRGFVYVPTDDKTKDFRLIENLILYQHKSIKSDTHWRKFKWVDPAAQKRRVKLEKYINELRSTKAARAAEVNAREACPIVDGKDSFEYSL